MGILTDWIIQVHQSISCRSPCTLTVEIIVRYISMQSVLRTELQLVGVSPLLILQVRGDMDSKRYWTEEFLLLTECRWRTWCSSLLSWRCCSTHSKPSMVAATAVYCILYGNDNWKQNIIHTNFLPVDAELILKLKPSRQMTDDILAWQPEISGIFCLRCI
jgi:hypothetical protein